METAELTAHSDVVLAISPSELKQIKGYETAYAVWQKLHTIYQSTEPTRTASLTQLSLQKMAEKGDVLEHILKFFDAVDKL